MNWLDFVIIAVLGIPGFIGFRTGIIKMIATLGGLIVGFILAGQLKDTVGSLLSFATDSESTQGLLGFFIVLVGTVIVAWIIASFVKKILSALFLGWVDTAAGALIGVAMGSAIVAPLLWGMDWAGLDSTIDGSTLAPFFLDVVGTLVEAFSSNAKELITGA